MKKNIRNLLQQLQKINEESETNVKLTMIGNDPYIQHVTVEMNRALEKSHQLAATIRMNRDKMQQEVANISHDFRTPLTSIQGFIELILKQDLSVGERTAYLQIVSDKIAVLTSVTEAFYELSLHESGELPKLQQVDLVETITETLLPFYHDFNRKGIQVNVEKTDENLIAFLDQAYMQRILINLIQNALRYAKSFFEITLVKDAETITMTVRNDHEGMNGVDIPSLFHRTFTFSDIRSHDRLGLGLFIVKELVEKQHGNVVANNEDGEFTLRITFPC